jgi:hypothetical protein
MKKFEGDEKCLMENNNKLVLKYLEHQEQDLLDNYPQGRLHRVVRHREARRVVVV